MPTKTTIFGASAETAPWQDLEKQAYHAYREWHLWLVLRERELAERNTAGRTDKRPASPAPVTEKLERQTIAKGETTK